MDERKKTGKITTAVNVPFYAWLTTVASKDGNSRSSISTASLLTSEDLHIVRGVTSPVKVGKAEAVTVTEDIEKLLPVEPGLIINSAWLLLENYKNEPVSDATRELAKRAANIVMEKIFKLYPEWVDLAKKQAALALEMDRLSDKLEKVEEAEGPSAVQKIDQKLQILKDRAKELSRSNKDLSARLETLAQEIENLKTELLSISGKDREEEAYEAVNQMFRSTPFKDRGGMTLDDPMNERALTSLYYTYALLYHVGTAFFIYAHAQDYIGNDLSMEQRKAVLEKNLYPIISPALLYHAQAHDPRGWMWQIYKALTSELQIDVPRPEGAKPLGARLSDTNHGLFSDSPAVGFHVEGYPRESASAGARLTGQNGFLSWILPVLTAILLPISVIADTVRFAFDQAKTSVTVLINGNPAPLRKLMTVVYQPTAEGRHITYYNEGRVAELLAPLLPSDDPVLKRL